MRLVVLHNPRSGRGLAARLAERLHRESVRRGHRVKALAVGGGEPLDPGKLASSDALVIVGGDGTVNRCASAAIRAAVAIYHVPTGNENLFARAMGMGRSPERVLDAVEHGTVAYADAGRCGDRPFVIMASVGPDAGVVRRVAEARTRAIGHLAYIEPVVRELLRPRLPRLVVEVDGRRIVDGRRGLLVVANTREYAARLDPCPRASLFSGRLHAAFLPARTSAGAVRWAVPAWCRGIEGQASAVIAEGREVRIRSEGPDAPLQLDGEWHQMGGDGSPLDVSLVIEPGVLPVVLPQVGAVPAARVRPERGVKLEKIRRGA